jgi:hypothetical protein
MTIPGPIKWYYYKADLICPDGPSNEQFQNFEQNLICNFAE